MSEGTATKQFKMSEHERELNRKRVAKARAKKKEQVVNQQVVNQQGGSSSYDEVVERLNTIMKNFGVGTTIESLYGGINNGLTNPSMLNRAVKAVSSLPVDYTKEEIAKFLQNPYGNEKALRETSEILKWTAYPYSKVAKAYQDISTYHYCTTPLYLTKEIAKSEEYKREEKLLDKLNKTLKPDVQAHRIAGQAIMQGKAFYYLRTKVDKVHNHVNYAFMQQLPTDYCEIIGRNNQSGWTIAFNLMYFMQSGTDPLQYGELFKPYLDDFNDMFYSKGHGVSDKTYINCKGKQLEFYPSNIKENAAGNPKIVKQAGEWAYMVVLPTDKCYAFEIDDATVAVASILSGLMLTYAQQSDREAMETSLLLNPLLMLFTGEIPYFNDNLTTKEDGIRLSIGARTMFEQLFSQLMSKNNASGTAFYSAPVNNIKSHTFPEVTKANEISSSYNRYAVEKSGLGSIIPLSDPKAGQANLSALLESRYTNCIYRQFEVMMKNLYESLNLKYDWDFTMFGSIYTDDLLREHLEKRIANGDTSVYPYLAALDGQSMLDKISIMHSIKESGFIDLLTPPETSYTQTSGGKEGSGRPKNKTTTEGSEKTEDSGGR